MRNPVPPPRTSPASWAGVCTGRPGRAPPCSAWLHRAPAVVAAPRMWAAPGAHPEKGSPGPPGADSACRP
eukprot:3669128-Alexandrium_andersonii.AAC.1